MKRAAHENPGRPGRSSDELYDPWRVVRFSIWAFDDESNVLLLAKNASKADSGPRYGPVKHELHGLTFDELVWPQAAKCFKKRTVLAAPQLELYQTERLTQQISGANLPPGVSESEWFWEDWDDTLRVYVQDLRTFLGHVAGVRPATTPQSPQMTAGWHKTVEASELMKSPDDQQMLRELVKLGRVEDLVERHQPALPPQGMVADA